MEETKEINQIGNVVLVRDVIDKAINFLISQNKFDPNTVQDMAYQYGYIYTRTDGYVEALFKIEIGNDRVFYMALQENKLILLNISEVVYNATVEGMKNEHECLRENSVA